MLIAAVFVGSQACRPCHAVITDEYAKTPMARSSGRAAPLPTANFSAAGHRYNIEGNRLSFDGGSAPIDYFVGSNSEGRSYLQARDGYLFELPITWYVRKNAWDASPGYERDTEVRLNRAVEPSCLQCHASQVRPVLGTQNRYGDPPFQEGGVSCERCHGPGGDHVKNPASFKMVNPAKLNAERRDSVCSQCHLTGEARIEQTGKRFSEFQAGERLADYASYFVWKLGRTPKDSPAKRSAAAESLPSLSVPPHPLPADLKVTSHVEKLAASVCKTKAGDRLWCGSCHDPHSNTDKTQQACLSCHAQAHRQTETCATCHMPKARAIDANHGVMTDHSIPRQQKPSSPPVPGELLAFIGVVDDRALGLAYAELGDKRAREYLLRAKPSDWPVRLRLAALEPAPAKAAALYESVLRERPGDTVALVNLGAIYGSAGRLEDAAKLWRRALETNPAIEEAALNLSQILPAQEAEAILRRYLDVNPAARGARARLNVVQKKLP